MYAKAGFEFAKNLPNYNGVVSGCAQSAENFMKAVIEVGFDTDDSDVMKLMHSHNLRALRNKIVERYEFDVSSRDCKWLGDFYFDARYPGDNYICTNQEDASEALKILNDIKDSVSEILLEIKTVREKEAGTLKDLKAFE